MQSPLINFPFVAITSQGVVVQSGVVKIDYGWMVIAVATSHSRPAWTANVSSFEEAVAKARDEAVTWYEPGFANAA